MISAGKVRSLKTPDNACYQVPADIADDKITDNTALSTRNMPKVNSTRSEAVPFVVPICDASLTGFPPVDKGPHASYPEYSRANSYHLSAFPSRRARPGPGPHTRNMPKVNIPLPARPGRRSTSLILLLRLKLQTGIRIHKP